MTPGSAPGVGSNGEAEAVSLGPDLCHLQSLAEGAMQLMGQEHGLWDLADLALNPVSKLISLLQSLHLQEDRDKCDTHMGIR